MTDYKKYINALRKCAKEHENDRTFTGHIIVSDLCRDTSNLLEALEQQPKTGHWIHLKHNKGKCSECHDVVLIAQMYGNANYCPNCGARMIEPQAESEG